MNQILVIEDEQRVAELLQTGLEESGYKVIVAVMGQLACDSFFNILLI